MHTGVVADSTLAKFDQAFRIAGHFDGHRDAQRVDFAAQVNGMFQLIRHLCDERFSLVEQFHDMRRSKRSKRAIQAASQRQIRVCCHRLRREHA